MRIVTYQVNGEWVRFPGTKHLDPDKIARLLEDGVWGVEEMRLHNLRAATPFVVPDGERVVGAERFSANGLRQIFDTEVIPPERKMIHKWVVMARLTDPQLEAAINGMTVRQRERWRAPAFPKVYVDDPELLQVLGALGADPKVVLRDGEEV